MTTDSANEPLTVFVERVLQQLAKHGFPERTVSFPIERMYEAAAAKELSFNRVLEVLRERGIDHEKTPEKVIFRPLAARPAVEPNAFAGIDPAMLQGIDPAMLQGIDPAMLQGIDPAMLRGIDPAMLQGMSREQLLAAAQAAMQQLGPEQLAAIQAMVSGMTPEQQAEMLEQARKLGLL